MKLLLVLALLLLVREAGAGEPLTIVPDEGDRFQYTLTGALKIDRASFQALLKDYPEAKLRVILVPSRCEALMRDAMKAMEPFLLNGPESHHYKGENLVVEFWPKEAVEAHALWNAAKAACWRTP